MEPTITSPSSKSSNRPPTDASSTLAGSRTGDVEESEAIARNKIIADPKGDIIFLVGPDDDRTKIQVSSKALGLASPVFLAWFSPRYLEGTPTESGAPRTVRLPDDDPAAMTILCYVLHFQSDQVSMTSFTVFENLALLCDKYDCSRALKPWATSWSQRWPGSGSGEDNYFCMTNIAFAFDLPGVFHKATLEIFRDAPGAQIANAGREVLLSQTLPTSFYRTSDPPLLGLDCLEWS